jgi:hypothetical protein
MTVPPDRQDHFRKLQRNFDATTSAAYLRAGGNVVAVSTLSAIERRAETIKQRAVRHYKAFEDRWTAKEMLRLWQRQLAQHAKYPPPPGVAAEVSPEAIFKLAARNVKARTNRRLSQINAIKTRMSNAVVRNFEQLSLARNFRQSVSVAAPPVREQKLRKKL